MIIQKLNYEDEDDTIMNKIFSNLKTYLFHCKKKIIIKNTISYLIIH